MFIKNRSLWKALNMKQLFLFAPLLLLLSIPLLNRKKMVLFPQSEVGSFAFSDQSDMRCKDGNSTLDSFFVSDSILHFGFTLKKGYEYPYAGVVFTPMHSSTWNFSSFDYVQLTFQNTNMDHIRLHINSELSSERTSRVRLFELKVEPSQKRYTIPIKEIETPIWWYSNNSLSPENLHPTQDFEKVKTLSLENSTYSQIDSSYTVGLESLSLHRSYNRFYLLGVAWLVFLFLLKFRPFKKESPNSMEYQQLTLTDPNKVLFQELLSYMGDHFSETELSLATTSSALHISSRRIAELFREESEYTFKQYLNSIRLKEAHRLLLTEKFQISQILFAVGFNSPSHFNRLFIKEFGLSPTELRKQNREEGSVL